MTEKSQGDQLIQIRSQVSNYKNLQVRLLILQLRYDKFATCVPNFNRKNKFVYSLTILKFEK